MFDTVQFSGLIFPNTLLQCIFVHPARLKGSGVTKHWHAGKQRWATAREKLLGMYITIFGNGCVQESGSTKL